MVAKKRVKVGEMKWVKEMVRWVVLISEDWRREEMERGTIT